MSISLMDNARIQIKSGIAYVSGSSGISAVEVAFPIATFRQFIALGQQTLNEFDMDTAVISFHAPKRQRKGGR